MGSLFKPVMRMRMYPRAWATVASQGLFQSMVKGRSCQILPSLHGNLALPFSHCPFSSPQPHCDHASRTTGPWKEKNVGTSPIVLGASSRVLWKGLAWCVRGRGSMTPVQKAAGLGHNYNREYTNLSTAEETGHSPYFPERGSIPFC